MDTMELQQKKKEDIFFDIDSYSVKLLEMRKSEEFMRFIKFTRKIPDHASFNNALVFIQNPECFYYATKNQWEKKFNRKIIENARPELILMPFKPVEFVYDISQTEGDPLPENFLYWWKEKEGEIDELILKNTIASCFKLNIPVSCNDTLTLDFKEFELRTMGTASRKLSNDARMITLHPRYTDIKNRIEAYGVLCHEIAHHLLGHLGEQVIYKYDKNLEIDRHIPITKDRRKISHAGKELEAEICAFLVFAHLGIEKRSDEYLAGYIVSNQGRSEFSMVEVLKVVDKIKKMGEGDLSSFYK